MLKIIKEFKNAVEEYQEIERTLDYLKNKNTEYLIDDKMATFQSVCDNFYKNEEKESKYDRFLYAMYVISRELPSCQNLIAQCQEQIRKTGLEKELDGALKKIQQTNFIKFISKYKYHINVPDFDVDQIYLDGTLDTFFDNTTGEPTSDKMICDLTDKDFIVLDKLMRQDLLFHIRRADISGDKKEKKYLKSLCAEEYQRAASLDNGQDL